MNNGKMVIFVVRLVIGPHSAETIVQSIEHTTPHAAHLTHFGLLKKSNFKEHAKLVQHHYTDAFRIPPEVLTEQDRGISMQIVEPLCTAIARKHCSTKATICSRLPQNMFKTYLVNLDNTVPFCSGPQTIVIVYKTDYKLVTKWPDFVEGRQGE